MEAMGDDHNDIDGVLRAPNATALGSASDAATGIDDVWQTSEYLWELACLLPMKTLKGRTNMYLVRLIERFQNYATSSSRLSDKETESIGDAILRICRLGDSLAELVGPTFADVKAHDVKKELLDLFSESAMTFETAEFNIFTAAMFQMRTGIKVFFIPEENRKQKVQNPDLLIGDLCYVESKDLHTMNRSSIAVNVAGKIEEAAAQLKSRQSRHPLSGSGICIDMPWGVLPLHEEEGRMLVEAIMKEEALDFVLLSTSGLTASGDHIGFPVAQSLIWKPQAIKLYAPVFRKLTRQSHILLEGAFELVEHLSSPEHKIRELLTLGRSRLR